MDPIIKLRGLIWDKDAKIFSSEELEEYLNDTANPDGTQNVYRAAAFCLDIVRADPERITQYSRGGVSITKQELDKAIKRYESMSGDRNVQTVSTRRDYRNETSKGRYLSGRYR